MERIYTAGEVIAALAQARRDIMEIPVGDGIGHISDEGRLDALVALSEAATYLDIPVDYIENRTPEKATEYKS